MEHLVLRNAQCPGDLLMLSAAIRDLHVNYPNRFKTHVDVNHPELFANNPFVESHSYHSSARIIECENTLINQSNSLPFHFIHSFREDLSQKLNLKINSGPFCGEVYLDKSERAGFGKFQWLFKSGISFWLIVAGGKDDVTIKWWLHERYQHVVDEFRDKILFVQVGDLNHYHPALRNVVDLRGLTSLRDMVQLMHFADGVVCPVTFAMHLAAATPVRDGKSKLRACVVVAGGREPAHWEAYPGHQYLHTIGSLPCCNAGGCWKRRTKPLYDGSDFDSYSHLCVDTIDDLPHCMHLISSKHVIESVKTYYSGGALSYLTRSQKPVSRQLLSSNTPRKTAISKTNGLEMFVSKAISTLEYHKHRRSGYGVVLVMQDVTQFARAWLTINILRLEGCPLPVEIWHASQTNITPWMQSAADNIGATFKCALPILESLGNDLHLSAILHSEFKHILCLTPEYIPVSDCGHIFNSDEYRKNGFISWDIHSLNRKPHSYSECPPFFIDTTRLVENIQLTEWIGRRSSTLPHSGFWANRENILNTSSLATPQLPIHSNAKTKDITLQNSDSENLFVFNQSAKFDLFDGCVWHSQPGLQNKCSLLLSNLRTLRDQIVFGVAPLHNSAAPCKEEQESIIELTSNSYQFYRIGYDYRVMTFKPDGYIGKGSAQNEIFWSVSKTANQMTLSIASNTQVYYELKRKSEILWFGRCLLNEQMPVQLSLRTQSD